ncbi:MAG: hypothetical protein RR705_00740 [Lachnospiraceae bacterium]
MMEQQYKSFLLEIKQNGIAAKAHAIRNHKKPGGRNNADFRKSSIARVILL